MGDPPQAKSGRFRSSPIQGRRSLPCYLPKLAEGDVRHLVDGRLGNGCESFGLFIASSKVCRLSDAAYSREA
jgi:hypothetical protein